ncbi:MAG: efflux RND transporter permease subunit [Acidiferrobacterales bacterium]|nr:efflux RND transporter permease subunit [Acidiferrobacterales bacterium]
MIEWFARNPVAANLLMFAIIIAGLSSLRSIPLEVFPSFEVESVGITTVFRGATPQSVEDGVSNRIEETIYDIEGIKQISSRSAESFSTVIAEVEEGYDRRQILNDVKLKVDALNTLPLNAEKPIVSLIESNEPVITVAVLGDVDTKTLRLAAEQVKTDLLQTPEITLVELVGVTDYEISIELTPQTLDNYNLTLEMVARAVQLGSADISAGNVQTRDGDILVRADGQAYNRSEFANIPVISQFGADPVMLGEIATIIDGFEEQPLITEFNGKPAILMQVTRTGAQSSIRIADLIKSYMNKKNSSNTNGIELAYYDDDSEIVKSRLSTLVKSGIQGGILVLLLLSLFLRPAVAFWVFLGIPVSFIGAFIVMPFFGGTFNALSLFAFIVVLGIVVDDAIVTGENIYRKMREGHDSLDASIIGTKEIATPVTFGILTTMVAFLPLLNMGSNRIGYFATQFPLIVIPVLIFSLIESKFVLPAHLSHVKPRSDEEKTNWLSRTQLSISRGFESFVEKKYKPFLKRCLYNKAVSITLLLTISATVLAYALNGHIRFTFFPSVEAEQIRVSLSMPDTTGFEVTHGHIEDIVMHATSLREKYRNSETGISAIKHIYSTSGSQGGSVKPSVGQVNIELFSPEERAINIRTSQIARELRTMIGEIPGAQELSIVAQLGRAGSPIDIELSGATRSELRDIGEQVRTQLQRYPAVFDIQDNFLGGKQEFNIKLKPQAVQLGLDLVTVANQIRGSIFGLEAQRVQRGKEEVRVMVRLPLQFRSSIEDLMKMPIQVGQSNEPVPLSDLVIFESERSPTTLYRLNRKTIVNVTADVDKDIVDMPAIMRDLRVFFDDLVQSYPSLSYTFRGEAEEQSENFSGLSSGLVFVLVGIYALLAIPFKSYTQPLIVMSIMPFSVIGAIIGHILVGFNLSMLSIIGMMALLGVVVNDSLVLVDYINKQRQRGMEVFEAVLTSGAVRFRPVILTSITTFAGLTPLLLDSSTQSEFLKPMAVSLGFGIMFCTAITLIIVPINYLIACNAKQAVKKLWSLWLDFWNREDAQV